MTDKTTETAKLLLPGQEIEFSIVEGTEGEKSIDIGALRAKTGYITLDPGYVNTGACESSITFLNGEKGILRHRGYSIEDLADDSSFTSVSYLLAYGSLPTAEQHAGFEERIRAQYALAEPTLNLVKSFKSDAHPMAVLSAAMVSLAAQYPTDQAFNDGETIPRMMAQSAVVTAVFQRLSQGKAIIDPDPSLGYCENFLHMLFGDEESDAEMDELMAKVLNRLLILHADHEQNCSTSTVRIVRSSDANPYASISSGINALWGPLHGGANQAVMEMLQQIHADGGDIDKTMEKARNKEIRLMGFGHRVYKTYDPRARIAKKSCDEFLEKLGFREGMVDIAMKLEDAALADDYFKSRNLYPNVDFYTGIIYRAMRFDTDMFTALFAIGRLPGWMAHAVELEHDPKKRIGRPRQVYQGEVERKFVPRAERA